MVNWLKKFATVALALSLSVSSVLPVAAAKSNNTGKTDKTKYVHKYVKQNKERFTTFTTGNASFVKNKVNTTKFTVPTTVKYKGLKYKVRVIRKYAFNKTKKVKKVYIKSNIFKIKKNAFTGSKVKTVTFCSKSLPKNFTIQKGAFKKSKVKTIKVTSKMSKESFSRLKAALKAAGFKVKNIKRY